MPRKKPNPEDVVAKLRQVDVLVSQGRTVADAVRTIGVTQFFELADIAKNARRGKSAAAILPIALEAVTRIDALFAIELAINGRDAAERLRVRQEQSAPLVAVVDTAPINSGAAPFRTILQTLTA